MKIKLIAKFFLYLISFIYVSYDDNHYFTNHILKNCDYLLAEMFNFLKMSMILKFFTVNFNNFIGFNYSYIKP